MLGRVTFLLAIVAPLVLGAIGAKTARADVDWQRGLIVARGAAVGDVRAPTRALARIKAERRARQRAAAAIRAEASGVPVAGGGSVARHARGYLDEIGDRLVLLESDFGSDGSVVVTMALPIDALRAAVFGRDAPRQAAAPAVILVQGEVRPMLGLELAAGPVRYRGPTIYLPSMADARRQWPGAPEFRVRSAGKERIEVEGETSLEDAAKAHALVVLAGGK